MRQSSSLRTTFPSPHAVTGFWCCAVGRCWKRGVSSTVLSAPRHPYTKALLAAQVANGMQPSPILREGVSGCPFYARCPEADAACLNGAMQKHTDGKDRMVVLSCLKLKTAANRSATRRFCRMFLEHSRWKHHRGVRRKRHRKIDACKNSLRRDMPPDAGGGFS